MNHESLMNMPPFEAPPPEYAHIEIEATKKRRTSADRDKARRFNEGRTPQNPDIPLGQPTYRENAINRGIIKRSQRRAKRPH
jgi:hypothetical protein